MINFKLIIKQSDINELDNLIRIAKVRVFVINDDEYCIMQKTHDVKDNEFSISIYIWPRSWGYSGHKDGHCIYINKASESIFLNYTEWLVDVINKLNKTSLAKDSLIEIVNDN